jgi:hypothetical protein
VNELSQLPQHNAGGVDPFELGSALTNHVIRF